MFIMYEEYKKSPTFKLFSVPNFVSGLASVLDVGATLSHYNYSNSPEEADKSATYSDWQAVGIDILIGMDEWEKENVQFKE